MKVGSIVPVGCAFRSDAERITEWCEVSQSIDRPDHHQHPKSLGLRTFSVSL